MSKVICDVCGTAYLETATSCPICGCAKSSAAQTTAADSSQTAGAETAPGYTYVKGGRFSKRNVRKRNQKNSPPERRTPPRQSNAATSSTPRQSSTGSTTAPRQSSAASISANRQARAQQREERTNRSLLAVVVILLVAIIAVVIYIVVRIFGPATNDPNPTGTKPTTSQDGTSNTDDTGNSIGVGIPCTALELSSKTIEFTASSAGNWQLMVNPVPADTTDKVEFSSSDTSVVIVDQDGLIKAVGSGNAVITVKCGNIVAECNIISSIGGSNPNVNPDPDFVFVFNTPYKDATTGTYDTSLMKKGETWRAYKNDLTVDVEQISWVSDDPAVCTIEKGIVTAVGPGVTKVHAIYGGKTFTCVIRCNFADTPDVPDTGYRLSHTDVTIDVNESFRLLLIDKDNNAVTVTWTAADSSIVTINGNKIVGAASGTTEVSCTHEGVTYTCIVRVK